MRIVIFGACGQVGKGLAGELAEHADDYDLTLVDIDATAIDAMRPSLPAPVSLVHLDPTGQDAALAVAQGADLVVNCAGAALNDEFFNIAVRVGANYTDMISDPKPAQSTAAEEADIVWVPGLGFSPGLTNVLVRHAADAMDTVQEAEISFVVYRPIASTYATLDATVRDVGEHNPDRVYFMNGRFVPADARDGSKVVCFSEPFGKVAVYFRPHPEVRSLPRNFPTLRFCAVRAAYQDELLQDMWTLNRLGLLDEKSQEATKNAIWRRLGGKTSPLYDGSGAVKVEVTGLRANRTVRRTYDLNLAEGRLYSLTGVCAAVGVRLLGRDGAVKTGVVDPESYFDANEYLDELQRGGMVPLEWSDEELSG